MKAFYPLVRRSAAEYMLHGTAVPDPYDWLEDPSSTETAAFVTAQNECFKAHLGGFSHVKPLTDYLTHMRNYARVGAPRKNANGDYYFFHNTGLQNQAVLKRIVAQQGELAADNSSAMIASSTAFLDPNKLSEDGVSALGSTGWSKSGKYYGYGVCERGSDWNTLHIRDTASGEDLPDVLKWVKFSGVAWVGDSGFFYTRFPSLAEGQEMGTETTEAANGAVYYHTVGQPQDQDVKILCDPEHPKWLVGVWLTTDEKYLVASWHDGCEPNNVVWVAEAPADFASDPAAKAAQISWCKLLVDWDAKYDVVGNDGSKFYFMTTKDASRRRVVAVDVNTPAARAGKPELIELVPEHPEALLEDVSLVGDYFLYTFLEDVKSALYVARVAAPRDMVKIPLPIGSLVGMNCRRESTFVSLKLSSFVLPGRSMWFELTSQTTLPPQVNIFFDEGPEGFDGADVDVEQIFYQSPAGEKKVPMFICKAKGYVPDGATPTILYCYGGFGISITPSFSLQAVAWVKKFGGVYAVANIRGGGEYGEAWHDAGKQRHKENCFTDLAAGAEELIRRNYCSPATLAINGGSNGGLVVSATGLKHPHLFRAVIADVGVLDCFKFHKFTIGHAWRSDFGDPDVEADFRILQTYSPLHNVRCNVGYPAFLIKTGDHDDRVVPLHSLKFLATLQHANPEQTGADGSRTGPFLGRIEVAAGHGAGKPTSKILQETAETLAFAATELGARYVA